MTVKGYALGRLLRALESAGCDPWPVGDGQWLAPCPTCRAEGRDSLVEIRAGETGIVVCCIEAHEPRPPRRRAA